MTDLDAERNRPYAGTVYLSPSLYRQVLIAQQGQANHFFRYAPERIEYGIKRYQTETKRL